MKLILSNIIRGMLRSNQRQAAEEEEQDVLGFMTSTDSDLSSPTLQTTSADTGSSTGHNGNGAGLLFARGRLKKILERPEFEVAEPADDDPVIVAPPPSTAPEAEQPAAPDETKTGAEAEQTPPEPETQDTPPPDASAGPDTQDPAPQEPAPEETEPQETAPQDPTPEETAPEVTAPEDQAAGPEDTAPQEPAPDAKDGADGESTTETDPEMSPETGTAPVEAAPDDSATGPIEPADPVAVNRQVAPTVLDGAGALSVPGGRVTTLSLPEPGDIAGVTITGLPAAGNVTVNPDFTLALVLSGNDYSGPLSFDYAVTHKDGSVTTHRAELEVAEPLQGAGWGLGNHYMLATDADGKLVVEHGDNHRTVYISGSEDALTLADIAAIEGLSESQINGRWLSNNPEYGGSEGMALAVDAGMALWHVLSASDNSNWLMFERGYSYEGAGRIIRSGHSGESELAPVHITSWGEGERPVLPDYVRMFQNESANIVFTELAFTGGIQSLSGHNTIFSDVDVTQDGFNIQGVSGFALRNATITHVVKQEQLEGDYWDGKKAGLFINNTDGILLENNLFHHNGWMADYLPDGSVEGGAPPNMYSHNVYLQNTTTDVTVRDNIFSQAASIGLQLRGGGFAENNAFLDNNVHGGILGGYYKGDGHVGNFTLFMDNIVTSAGFKRTDMGNIGALDWGIDDKARLSTHLSNIYAHKADPNNPDESAWKTDTRANPHSFEFEAFFEDTIVYNWNRESYDRNLDGLDPEVLNQITIQNFAAAFFGAEPGAHPDDAQMPAYYKSGWITALMDHATENWADGTLAAGDIVDWFQAGFGLDPAPAEAAQHRFIPNDLGDGIRWDNRLNWSTDQRPGDGDLVDLGGNWVNYAGTTDLAGLSLGEGGKLKVGQGKLTVDALDAGGMLFIEGAGQFWTDGYAGDGMISAQVSGGRFANTGEVSGTISMSVTGGQAILGVDNASFMLGADSALSIEGSSARVGFDGAEDGIATLQMAEGGSLSFVADASGVSTLREFRSGVWDQEGSAVHSGVAMSGTLSIDLGAFDGTGTLTLIDVDALAGIFDATKIHGLGTTRDAQLVIDYAEDLLRLELSAGSGQASLLVIGDALDGSDENADLWDALNNGLAPTGGATEMELMLHNAPLEPLHDMSFL